MRKGVTLALESNTVSRAPTRRPAETTKHRESDRGWNNANISQRQSSRSSNVFVGRIQSHCPINCPLFCVFTVLWCCLRAIIHWDYSCLQRFYMVTLTCNILSCIYNNTTVCAAFEYSRGKTGCLRLVELTLSRFKHSFLPWYHFVRLWCPLNITS